VTVSDQGIRSKRDKNKETKEFKASETYIRNIMHIIKINKLKQQDG